METIDFNEVIRDPETISVVGGLLGTDVLKKISIKFTDAAGSGLLQFPTTGFVLAVDLDNPSNYLVYAFFKKGPGMHTSISDIVKTPIISNGLVLGNHNSGGTCVVHGGSNVKQFMIGLGL